MSDMLPDWLKNMKMLNIPNDMQNKFKEDTLLKYENKIDRLTKKCNKMINVDNENFILKSNLKHFELMKEEMENKNKLIKNLQQKIMSLRDCNNCNKQWENECGGHFECVVNDYKFWALKEIK